MKKEDILEVVSDDGLNTSADPIATKSNKRPADTNKPGEKAEVGEKDIEGAEDTTVGKKSPKRMADKVAESVEEMFEGMDFTEDFKLKAAVVVESLVNMKVSELLEEKEEELRESLEAEYETKLTEANQNLEDKVDSYLDFVVKEWADDNKVAIEETYKVEMANSFMESLKTLFEEHNVEVDLESVDIVSEMERKINTLEETLEQLTEEKLNLAEDLERKECDSIFSEATETLTDSQKDKFGKLVEGLYYKDAEDFKSRIEVIKENYFSTSTKGKSSTNGDPTMLNEEVNLAEDNNKNPNATSSDPRIAGYANFLSSKAR